MAYGEASPAPSGQPSFDYKSILARAKVALDSAVEVAIPVTDIRRYEDQPRKHFAAEGIRRLRDSIAAGGQTTSGLIRLKPAETPYELIDGERRWRAVTLIPEDERPLYKAKLIEADDDVIQFLISGVSNFNREGHTALETTDTIDRLTGFGFPMEEIAAVLGISVHWAYQLHGLKKLTPEVKELLNPDLPKKLQLPVTAAIQISKIDGKFQASLAKRVLERDVSLGTLRAEVVRVAKDAGSAIRVREVDPRKKWESTTKKADVALRALWDLKTLLNDPELLPYLKQRTSEADQIIRKLSDSAKTIWSCDARIKSVKGTT